MYVYRKNKAKMFCPSGCFVPPDVFSPRTFCPSGRLVHGYYVSGRYVSGRFFLQTFCPSGRLISGFFVWAPVGKLIHNWPEWFTAIRAMLQRRRQMSSSPVRHSDDSSVYKKLGAGAGSKRHRKYFSIRLGITTVYRIFSFSRQRTDKAI